VTAHISSKGAVLSLRKIGGFVGGTVASLVVGSLVSALGGSFFTAFIISTIAYGPGIYYGVKIAKRYE
jgi:hypothetical protein